MVYLLYLFPKIFISFPSPLLVVILKSYFYLDLYDEMRLKTLP